MGFWDKFKRKKVVLIHEGEVVNLQGEQGQPMPRVQQQDASSMQVLSQGKALKTLKRKRRAKKRRAMK